MDPETTSQTELEFSRARLQEALGPRRPEAVFPRSHVMRALMAPEYKWARVLAVSSLAFALRRYLPLRHAGKAAVAVAGIRKVVEAHAPAADAAVHRFGGSLSSLIPARPKRSQ